MSDLTITTNHVPRLVIEPYELTAKEREDFDYLDWDAIERGEDSASFFRYKGNVYDLGDCETSSSTSDPFPGWHGYYSETFFSGVVFRYAEDTDYVIVGRYCA